MVKIQGIIRKYTLPPFHLYTVCIWDVKKYRTLPTTVAGEFKSVLTPDVSFVYSESPSRIQMVPNGLNDVANQNRETP